MKWYETVGWIAAGVVLILFVWSVVIGAPVPFKRARAVKQTLVGNYLGDWGEDEWQAILSEGGAYRGTWQGNVYVGTWGEDKEGRFWLTESCQPEKALSWQTYAIEWKTRTPEKLCGVVTVGVPGVKIGLQRVK